MTTLRESLRGQFASVIREAMDNSGGEVVWGQDDCGMWVAGMIVKVLGYDIAKEYRGSYSTREGAAKVLGVKGLIGALEKQARKNNWRRIPANQAMYGDVGVSVLPVDVTGRRLPSCMICCSPGWFVGRSSNGFTTLSFPHVSRVWSVLP